MQEKQARVSPPASPVNEVRLRVGIIAESQPELLQLKQIMHASKYQLNFSATADEAPELVSGIDVWILRLTHASPEMDDLVASLVLEDVPLVIDDASEDQAGRDIGFYTEKVDSAYAMHSMQSVDETPARHVWVIAASAGGPEAVITFLSALASMEAIETKSLAFVYAQHIDETGLDNLIHAMQRHTAYRVQRCQTGQRVSAGHIYVLSPNSEAEINDNRSFRITDRLWKGDYAPSISQAIAKVARVYKKRSGALIFSGMGDDGASALKLMKAMGGEVYTQSSATCAIDSMPNEALATGCVDFSGAPEELALKLLASVS